MGNLRKKGREDMGFGELVMLAVGLSMDAFAVSICKGLALQRVSWKECCIAGAWFGGFIIVMPGGIPPVDLMYYVPVFCMSKTARSVCGPKKSDGAREEKKRQR